MSEPTMSQFANVQDQRDELLAALKKIEQLESDIPAWSAVLIATAAIAKSKS